MTVHEYFDGPETSSPMELVRGRVSAPSAPTYGHQLIVTRATVLLDQHVRARGLGVVCVSPVDVVLDTNEALVLQPDLVFVSAERADIIRDRIWGAPDVVVEVLSPRTEVRDRTLKLQWYRQFGVQECWFVVPRERAVEIVDCQRPDGVTVRCSGDDTLRSRVLPDFAVTAAAFFETDLAIGRRDVRT